LSPNWRLDAAQQGEEFGQTLNGLFDALPVERDADDHAES
jgi:hypothetical protein